jgi:hypothetical protein
VRPAAAAVGLAVAPASSGSRRSLAEADEVPAHTVAQLCVTLDAEPSVQLCPV